MQSQLQSKVDELPPATSRSKLKRKRKRPTAALPLLSGAVEVDT
jgi:hypothetical protein